MGLFDFVKKAGERLLGGEPEPKKPSAPSVSPQEAQRLADRRLAAALVKFVDGLGLEVEELSIKVEGELATVGGKAPTQEAREKVILAVGNVEGVARVDDRMEVAAAEPEATFYTVQRGDTLSKIAKQHYGSAMKYPVIFEANRPMLGDPDKIYPGQVLRIPPLAP